MKECLDTHSVCFGSQHHLSHLVCRRLIVSQPLSLEPTVFSALVKISLEQIGVSIRPLNVLWLSDAPIFSFAFLVTKNLALPSPLGFLSLFLLFLILLPHLNFQLHGILEQLYCLLALVFLIFLVQDPFGLKQLLDEVFRIDIIKFFIYEFF